MKTHTAPVQRGVAHRKLAESVRRTVGSFLGTGFSSSLSHSKTELSPIAAGSFAALVYALIPILQMVFLPSSRELILLSWWGAIYFGIVTAFTPSTSLAVSDVIEVR